MEQSTSEPRLKSPLDTKGTTVGVVGYEAVAQGSWGG